MGCEGGVGGEGPKDVGGGVSGDVTVETGGEGYVDNVLDGKGEGGGVWVRVRRREVVEEAEVAVVIVECVEERTCGENVVVDGGHERVERVEFGPCEDDVVVILVEGLGGESVFGCVGVHTQAVCREFEGLGCLGPPAPVQPPTLQTVTPTYLSRLPHLHNLSSLRPKHILNHATEE